MGVDTDIYYLFKGNFYLPADGWDHIIPNDALRDDLNETLHQKPKATPSVCRVK